MIDELARIRNGLINNNSKCVNNYLGSLIMKYGGVDGLLQYNKNNNLNKKHLIFHLFLNKQNKLKNRRIFL